MSWFHDFLNAVQFHGVVRRIITQCAGIFCKNFVKLTFLLKSYSANWFHENFWSVVVNFDTKNAFAFLAKKKFVKVTVLLKSKGNY